MEEKNQILNQSFTNTSRFFYAFHSTSNLFHRVVNNKNHRKIHTCNNRISRIYQTRRKIIQFSQNTPQPLPENDTDSNNKSNSLKLQSGLRVFISTLSIIGVIESSFLSIQELLDPTNSFCPTDGCRIVLGSEYADAFGIPLSVIGLFLYSILTYISIYPYITVFRNKFDIESLAKSEFDSRQPLLIISTILSTGSVYNFIVMNNLLHAFCQFCILSGILNVLLVSTSFLLSNFNPIPSKSTLKSNLKIVSNSALIGLFFIGMLFFSTDPTNNDENQMNLSANANEFIEKNEGFQAPRITTESSEYAMELSRHLESKHVKMYGAYWCSHCYNQKQMFGESAFKSIQYVECDKKGMNSQRKLCLENHIPGYPTWEIDGEFYPGELELDDLAAISEFVNSN